MYYLYILKCADDSLYTGITNDLENRIKNHNSGKGSKYVRSRLPAVLVYKKMFKDKPAALKREAQIKDLSRSQKLKLLKQYSQQ